MLPLTGVDVKWTVARSRSHWRLSHARNASSSDSGPRLQLSPKYLRGPTTLDV